MKIFLPMLNIFTVKYDVMDSVVNSIQSSISWEGSFNEGLCVLCWPVNISVGHYFDYIY